MVRHNNMIPNGHFHKKWQSHLKLWFNQPMKKMRRKKLRTKKMLKSTPRPIYALRPVVNCPSARYNNKIRAGRGFTLQELKQAGINKKYGRTIGISVDYRRKNRCLESIARNVQRLKDYRDKLILYRSQFKENVAVDNGKNLNKIKMPQSKIKARIISDEEKKFSAFVTLRRARCDAKYIGVRAKRKASKSDTEDKIN